MTITYRHVVSLDPSLSLTIACLIVLAGVAIVLSALRKGNP